MSIFKVKMTNENVREGNEQLLQATRSQRNHRVDIFFLTGLDTLDFNQVPSFLEIFQKLDLRTFYKIKNSSL